MRFRLEGDKATLLADTLREDNDPARPCAIVSELNFIPGPDLHVGRSVRTIDVETIYVVAQVTIGKARDNASWPAVLLVLLEQPPSPDACCRVEIVFKKQKFLARRP